MNDFLIFCYYKAVFYFTIVRIKAGMETYTVQVCVSIIPHS